MTNDIKGYALLQKLRQNNNGFAQLIDQGLKSGKIRFFDQNEWDKIASQNFCSQIPEIVDFLDMFKSGYNIGNCVGVCWQLSFSYSNVDVVSGRLDILTGTLNAEKEGGHCWLETFDKIIDTTFLLVIDKSLKSDFGYIEEQRITADNLRTNSRYMARKEFVNDPTINQSKWAV